MLKYPNSSNINPQRDFIAPNLSVIIPTLNEENFLRRTIKHLFVNASHIEKLEILVIDAGSSDKTVASVQDLPVQVFVEPTFKLQKHESLNFGIKKSRGEILVFLDADTLVPKHFDSLILDIMKKKHSVGGAFEMNFVEPDLKLSLLSKLNAVRYRIWKTFYGDQAIFCKREVAIAVGGFSNTLMEAAYFCRSMKKQGNLCLINQPVETSARRFNKEGFWKVLWFDVKIWIRFILGRSLKNKAKDYWKIHPENG
ncbi:MAG: glycosyltransferase [Bacteroidota bacterium]